MSIDSILKQSAILMQLIN